MSLHELELKISRLLRGGVLFAGFMLLVGWLWMLSRNGESLSLFAVYHHQSLWESLQWAFIMNDQSVLLCFAGLFVLVTLPVFRVLMTGILFARQRERLLAFLAFVVFAALVASFFMGIEI